MEKVFKLKKINLNFLNPQIELDNMPVLTVPELYCIRGLHQTVPLYLLGTLLLAGIFMMDKNKPDRKTVTIRILIAVAFIICGLTIIPVNINNYYVGLETENWHKTEGTVIESRAIIGSSWHGSVRSPRIIYDYEIGGKT